MIAEKVSPKHPDKIADTIADMIVAEVLNHDPKNRVAVELQIGHGVGQYLIETTDRHLDGVVIDEIANMVLPPEMTVTWRGEIVPQDPELSKNQDRTMRAGDNGIFMAISDSMRPCHRLAETIVREIYKIAPYDGKIVVDDEAKTCTVCWSNIGHDQKAEIENIVAGKRLKLKLNPLGDWTGGIDVDTGVVNRKLASDQFGLECPIGGGGIHGKDWSKVDFCLPIYLKRLANERHTAVTAKTSIGDETITIYNTVCLLKTIKLSEIVAEISPGFNYREFGMWGL